MAGLLDPDNVARITPPSAGLLGDQSQVSQGSALADLYQTVSDEIARQQQISADRGLWANGAPTAKGLIDAAQQYSNALQTGTTAPEGGGFSLDRVHPRTLRPLSEAPDLTQAGSHAYSVKDPTGSPVGIVDTEWAPDTGSLHIADFQSEAGANSLGPTAVRQIRDALVARYPDATTLTGQRITGAVSADRASGSGPGRAATQTVRNSGQ
jgi:hypothetical protein